MFIYKHELIDKYKQKISASFIRIFEMLSLALAVMASYFQEICTYV